MVEENTNRNVFGINGIGGILISIVGLLVVLTVLMYVTVVQQRAGVANPYDPSVIRDINNIKMISVENKKFAFVEAKKDK
jgi:hypothetical protein